MEYNPHAPQIIGQEWVPIRNEDLVFDPFANTVERGYGFALDNSGAIGSVRFYINEFPPLFVRNQGYTASLYPRGTEASAGPVGRVLIPCNEGSIDSPGGNVVTSPAGVSVASCLYNPSANYFINYQIGNGSTNALNLWYATNSYANLLSGKRILGVNLLTGINVPVAATANPDNYAATVAGWLSPQLTNDAQYAVSKADAFVLYRPLVTFQTPVNTRLLVRTRMGDLDVPYGNNGAVTAGSPNVSQWTYPELQRFEAGAGAARLFMSYFATGIADAGAQVLILYSALEVFYCEERRVAFGSRNINGLRFVQARDPFQFGMNQILIRDIAGNLNPTIASGDYTVTLSEANTGDDFNAFFSPFQTAKVNELRQLYDIPTLQGTQINLPFPLNEDAVGTTLTAESTDLIPQLAIHGFGGNGAVFVQSHAYGRQSVGQVDNAVFVSQGIDQRNAGTPNSRFSDIRFWARRFGDTQYPLAVGGFTPAGVTTTTTPTHLATTPDNAALDIVGDIDLRADATLMDWAGSTYQNLIAKWQAVGNYSYILASSTVGNLQIAWSDNGTNILAIESNVPLLSVVNFNQRLAVRATLDVNNGAGGRTATFYTAPTIAGPWTILGTAVTQAGVTSIFSSSSIVSVGANNNGTGDPLLGTIHAVEIYNSIAGSVVANPVFSAQPPGTTSFTDAAGRVWTIASPAYLTGGNDGSLAYITPIEFDALDEVLDGWKQIDLHFSSPSYLGQQFTPATYGWTSGAAPGSRWEILGAAAFAASGIAQQMTINLQLGQVPTAQQDYAATYGTPGFGEDINEAWYPQLGPYLAGEDKSADVAVYLSQEQPAVTGFTVSVESQALTGIGLNCGIDPCGIPTHILHNKLNWSSAPLVGIVDSFSREVTGGWGTADTGETWIPETSELYLSSTAGSYASTPDNAVLDITGDFDLRADVAAADWTPAGNATLIGKWVNAGNQLSYALLIHSTGVLQVFWTTTGAPGSAVSAASTAFIPVANGARLAVRASVDVNNGAGGNTTTFYTAPTIAGPWTQLGNPVTNVGVSSVFSGSAPLEVGSFDNGTTATFTGSIYAAEVYNSVGTVVANPNFAAQPSGTTSFVDAAGRTWTINGSNALLIGSSAGLSVHNGMGVMTHSTGAGKTFVRVFANAGSAQQENVIYFSVPVLPVSGAAYVEMNIRYTDINNRVYAQVSFLNSITIIMVIVVNGVVTVVNPTTTALTPVLINNWYGFRVKGVGQTFWGKIWNAEAVVEPEGWSVVATNATVTTGNLFWVDTYVQFSNPVPFVFNFDNLSAANQNFGAYELQRSDTVENEFKTIMRATNPAQRTFNDYEARTDTVNSYRIRTVDVYDFASPWSSTVSISNASPGVSGSCLDNAHIMIFTTNERQNGFSNLAYSNAWENEVTEGFGFAEAGFTQLQPMFDRDFFTAFRPTERGGDQFSRTLLVQAAAIAPPTLTGFTRLSDMAWEDVSYICVRDEEGNRWFANVNVPNGVVRNRRRLYQADISIVEVTDTPSPADPDSAIPLAILP